MASFCVNKHIYCYITIPVYHPLGGMIPFSHFLFRVATTQGKWGIGFLLFPDVENRECCCTGKVFEENNFDCIY